MTYDFKPGDVYGRKYRGDYLYRVIADSVFTNPAGVQVQKCNSAGKPADNKIMWVDKTTMQRFWHKL